MADKTMLKVQTFGDFTLRLGSEVVMSATSRKNKVVYLLQYLLVHRDKDFSRDSLIKLLYGDDETKDPVNALKIIVHRLRKLLLSLGLPEFEYIIFEKGRYGWNNEIKCEVDIEVFDAAVKKTDEKTISEEDRLKLYLKIVDIYYGEFLPDLYAEDWVVPLSVHYQNLYHTTVHKVFDLLDKKGEYETMLGVSSRAAAIFPYDEEIQILKILSLHRKRLVKESIDAYNATVEMLLNEFGVNPSQELLEIYDEITKDISGVQDSILDIRNTISENDKSQGEGAYYSNFQSFESSYQLVVRNMERTGISAYLMLCTLDEKKDFDRLQTAIKEVLRKGDIFTRYSPNQYLILLMGIDYEKCEIVFKRIRKKFNLLCNKKCSGIYYSVASAVDTKWVEEKSG